MDNKRTTPRLSTSFNGVKGIVTSGTGARVEGTVVDSSLGGARIKCTPDGLRVGDEVELMFAFPTIEKVFYRAVVRHVDPAGEFVGIEFTSEPEPIVTHNQ